MEQSSKFNTKMHKGLRNNISLKLFVLITQEIIPQAFIHFLIYFLKIVCFDN